MPVQAKTSQTLIPGIVVDAENGILYSMAPGGGIIALSIVDGSLRWTSTHADQPLFVTKRRLLAMVDSTTTGLTIAALDVRSGELAHDTLALPLPAGVTASIDQSLESRFDHTVRRLDGVIYLVWDFLHRDVSGVAPAGGRAAERTERGAFRYSGDSFESVSPDSLIVDAPDWPSDLAALLQSQGIQQRPARAGSVIAIVEQRYDPERLILRRWRAIDGAPMEEETLVSARALAVLASCDERHIVVATPHDAGSPNEPYLLRYYDLDDAGLVAELASPVSAGPFCIFGSRLLRLLQPEWRRVQGTLVATPLKVVAVDIASGNAVWRRAVRDTAFRGPVPPAQ